MLCVNTTCSHTALLLQMKKIQIEVDEVNRECKKVSSGGG